MIALCKTLLTIIQLSTLSSYKSVAMVGFFEVMIASILFDSILGNFDITLTTHIHRSRMVFYHDIFSALFKYRITHPTINIKECRL